MLVFFDDILIYSQSLEEHVDHLRKTLQIFTENELHALMSKCQFGTREIEYFGQIIS